MLAVRGSRGGLVAVSMVCGALAGLALVPSSAAASSGWVTKAPLPVSEWGMASATGFDGRIYVFGGSNPASQTLPGQSFVYDPTTNRWSAIASMPLPVTMAGAALAPNKKIYVIGGYNAGPQNWVQAYDPATNTWSCSQPAPGCTLTSLAPLPVGRNQAGVVTGPRGTIWVFGGSSTGGVLGTIDIYDTTNNRWLVGPKLPQPLAGMAVTAVPNGNLIGLGGESAAGTFSSVGVDVGPPIPDFTAPPPIVSEFPEDPWIDDPLDLPPFPDPFDDPLPPFPIDDPFDDPVNDLPPVADFAPSFLPTSDLVGDEDPFPPFPFPPAVDANASKSRGYRLYLIGGTGRSLAVSATNRVYDSATRKWSLGPALPARRGNAAAVNNRGTLYVIGGDSGSPTAAVNTVYAYTPSATPALSVTIGHRSIGRHGSQSITVQAPPGARLTVTAMYPGGKRVSLTVKAWSSGGFIWDFRPPRGVKAGRVLVSIRAKSGKKILKAHVIFTLR